MRHYSLLHNFRSLENLHNTEILLKEFEQKLRNMQTLSNISMDSSFQSIKYFGRKFQEEKYPEFYNPAFYFI